MNAVDHTPIYSLTPFTLLDYPDKTACIIWFAGCNMRCSYCYNPEIVTSKGKLSFEEVAVFLRKRINLIDGVVLSGGECTSNKDLPQFARTIKKIGMNIKLDTNGSNPKMIQQLIDEQLIDYIALDFKATNQKFNTITNSKLVNRFEKTLDLLLDSQFKFEVRTTVHENLLSKKDIDEMIAFLIKKGYQGSYFLQQFVNNTPTIGNLGYSRNSLQQSDFSDSKIKVFVRN